MTDATQGGERADDIDDAIIVALSDYLDGALSGEAKADVEAKIASDPAWKTAHAEMVETRDALSGLQKARAPSTFETNVTEKINKRSAGRFFARKTLGDRVPFGALLVIALLLLIVIAYVMWASTTGSLKVDHPTAPPHHSGSALKP